MSFFNISTNDVYIRTGAVDQLFSLTSREFTIYKEPIKTIVSNISDSIYGYGDTQATNEEITFTPIYQSFSGRMIYPSKNQGNSKAIFNNKVNLNPNSTYIKMRSDAFSYLNNGTKTELIKFDGASWNFTDVFQLQNYLGLQFYYVEVEGTN